MPRPVSSRSGTFDGWTQQQPQKQRQQKRKSRLHREGGNCAGRRMHQDYWHARCQVHAPGLDGARLWQGHDDLLHQAM